MATNDGLQHSAAGGTSADGGNWLAGGNAWKIAAGPVLFLAVLMVPAFGPLQARVGFGILFWLGYYWVSGAVPLRHTIWVPLLAVALVPVIPLNKVVQAYVDKFILLIVATGFISGPGFTGGWPGALPSGSCCLGETARAPRPCCGSSWPRP